ncbi:MAG: PEGA domain-containing protein [Sorangiineae bacterium PRO1]|nr:PEGA domain-containing protein [Sorangiineae bacterium PRO1]
MADARWLFLASDDRSDHTPVSASSTPPPASASSGLPSSPPTAPALRRVRVETVPVGAIVTLDGEPLGPAPAIAALPEGSTVLIRAELAGYAPAERRVIVTEGAVARLDLAALVDAGLPATEEPAERGATEKRRRIKKSGKAEEAATVPAESTAKDQPPRPIKPLDLGSAAGPR